MNHNIDKVIETFCKVEKIVSSEKDRLMLGRLIHSLKRIETSLCKYGKMGRQICSFEKQLCDPWMEDGQCSMSFMSRGGSSKNHIDGKLVE